MRLDLLRSVYLNNSIHAILSALHGTPIAIPITQLLRYGDSFFAPSRRMAQGGKKNNWELIIESSFANAQLLEVKGDKGVKEDKDDSQSP